MTKSDYRKLYDWFLFFLFLAIVGVAYTLRFRRPYLMSLVTKGLRTFTYYASPKFEFVRLDQRLLLGTIPYDGQHLLLLRDQGVTNVQCMLSDWEHILDADEFESYGMEHKCHPTTDLRAPTIDNIQAVIASIVKTSEDYNGSTYVHCRAGRGRSAVVCICYFIYQYQMGVEEAIRTVTAIRPKVRLTDNQMQALYLYHQKHHKRSIPTPFPVSS